MEETPKSDIALSHTKALGPDIICVDKNEQLNVDTDGNSIAPACVNTEDEPLFDLMVLDDDCFNQLTSKVKNKLEIEKKLETRSNVADFSDATFKETAKVKTVNSAEVDDSNSEKISNDFIKPIPKAPESDSLILTADDELETEMSFSEKDKNEKSDKVKGNTFISVVPESSKKVEIEQIGEDNKNVISTDTKDTDKKISDTEACDSKNVHSFGSRFLWVSNITHSIKATELKQFISKVGKVITAKIVTDGKRCYGYVVMDNFQDASESLKLLNNAMFEGRKITVSFTKPAAGSGDKNKDSFSTKDNGKGKFKLNNESDDTKCFKSKGASRKIREYSKSRSGSVRKCRSRDPLTMKFKSSDKFYRRKASRSVERSSNDFLRDKLERDRLRRRILEEQRRSRDEMIREMHREEKQRELEFRLERDRRKLQFERELFERERRELYRLDAERRKIEKERLEVMQERTKLEKEYQKNRSTRKSDDFSLSSTIVKPQDSLKCFEKSKSKGIADSKTVGTLAHRIGFKDDFKSGKENRDRSRSRRGEDLKDYDRSIPPPPNLSNDFNLSTERKLKHQDFKRNVHGKVDHGGRKIEVIDRKYYPDRSHENADRKNENVYRKLDFDDRKTYSFSERKYDYGREAKKSRVAEFPAREPTIRNQWLPTSNYTEPWKTGLTTGITTSSVRYQDGGFSTPSYGGANRIPPVYCHSGTSTQQYQRYDNASQNTGRKY